MPQFLILANDYTDAYALERRLAIRPQHVGRMAVEKASGNFVFGGAKLGDDGNMVGSMLVINADSVAAARQWAQQDPYVTGKVWESVEVLPFSVAEIPAAHATINATMA